MRFKRVQLASFFVFGVMVAGTAAYLSRGPITPAEAQGGGLKVGDKAPGFTLPSATGGNVAVGDWGKSKATVVMFIATKCPFSNAYNGRMVKMASIYTPKGITFYGVNSNGTEPIGEVAKHAKDNGFTFPVLKDNGNKIADRFGAEVTPEVYVIDPAGKLVYKGQVDNRKEEGSVTERPLIGALDAILAGKPVPVPSAQAFGCTIKRG